MKTSNPSKILIYTLGNYCCLEILEKPKIINFYQTIICDVVWLSLEERKRTSSVFFKLREIIIIYNVALQSTFSTINYLCIYIYTAIY